MEVVPAAVHDHILVVAPLNVPIFVAATRPHIKSSWYWSHDLVEKNAPKRLVMEEVQAGAQKISDDHKFKDVNLVLHISIGSMPTKVRET